MRSSLSKHPRFATPSGRRWRALKTQRSRTPHPLRRARNLASTASKAALDREGAAWSIAARPVAIKVLSDELADAAARRRFQREAQTASSLNHPPILTVYDTGEIDGRQYLVTEFVDGGTLRDWAAKQQRHWQDVVEILTGVADGLATAHAAGILHRDIKPDNIVVTSSADPAVYSYPKLSTHRNIFRIPVP